MKAFSMVALIEKKKSGGRHTPEELAWLCESYLKQETPDYQVSAWLMAVRWRGLDTEETLALTEALVASGSTIDWPTDRPVVDKHSTGGVGDKTSLVLVPLLAAAGLSFAKMSGRGLGHTGGTLDKLEAIPGFRVNLSLDEIREQVGRIGCVLVGQTGDLVPADGALYALRDVTATVDSLPLVASSVMSKKLAGGAGSIVLDVKYGSGAFMKTAEEAADLARAMVRIGEGAGRRVRAVLSSMAEPLGQAVGNAIEVREAIETLRGEGPSDLRELTLELGAQLMVLARCTPSLEDGRTALGRLLESGVGLEKLAQLIEAQDGDPAVTEDVAVLPQASEIRTVLADTEGWVERFDARGVAEAALALGAGRRSKTDRVDPRTGVRILVRSGAEVKPGDAIAELHIGDGRGAEQAERALRTALVVRSSRQEALTSERTVV